MIDDLTVLTATFNRHEMTLCMIMSLLKNVKQKMNIVILDNSDSTRMKEIENATIIDNTHYKLSKGYGQISKNHCASIDYALKNLITTKYVLLCDNDILFNHNIVDLMNEFASYDAIGEIGWDDAPPDRLFPYMCFINVEKFKNEKINYFENDRCIGKGSRIVGPRGKGTPCWYQDTGASFLEDIKKNNWNIKEINLSDYIIHKKSGSHEIKHTSQWLNEHSDMWKN